jgi:hypothetical protein
MVDDAIRFNDGASYELVMGRWSKLVGERLVDWIGVPPRLPPRVAASTLEAFTSLWQEAGLQEVRTRQITVQRRFDSFDRYWHSGATSNTLRPMFDAMECGQRYTAISSFPASVSANG